MKLRIVLLLLLGMQARAFNVSDLTQAINRRQIDQVNAYLDSIDELLNSFPIIGNHESMYNPLMCACLKNSYEVVELLLDAGADVGCINFLGQTPLIIAVNNSEPGIVDLLLAQDDSMLDEEDKEGKTALVYAVESNDKAKIEILVDSGADLLTMYKGKSMIALAADQEIKSMLKDEVMLDFIYAVQHNKLEFVQDLCTCLESTIVKELIGVSVELSLHGKSMKASPLAIAAAYGYEAMATTLVKHGADCKQKTSYGVTPLMLAAEGNHAAIVKILLRNGAALDAVDNNGNTALCYGYKHKEVMDLMMGKAKESVINMQNNNGNSILHTVLLSTLKSERKLELVNDLLARGADATLANKKKQTPMSIASRDKVMRDVKGLSGQILPSIVQPVEQEKPQLQFGFLRDWLGMKAKG